MLVIIIVLSVIAALFNAWSAVIQRYEAGNVEASELFRKDFMKSLTKNPKWLGAFGLQILAFLFQAAALRNGSLIVVQPILTIDLIFLLFILYFEKHVPIGKREWIAILMICIGLSGTLLFASPKAGQQPYQTSSLILIICVITTLVLIAAFIVRRTKSKSYRALISAIGAGLSFALVDVFAKIVSRQVSSGLFFIVSHWQAWALAATGIISIIMAQNTYGSGPVAVSQPTMEIIEPIAGVALGIYIFGDSVNLSPVNLLLSLICAVIACSGIVLLSRSKILLAQEI
ncbi:MAG: DMT family transporter [Candidatus Saccharimonadales bacterium]